jgi:hypothetical protein
MHFRQFFKCLGAFTTGKSFNIPVLNIKALVEIMCLVKCSKIDGFNLA